MELRPVELLINDIWEPADFMALEVGNIARFDYKYRVFVESGPYPIENEIWAVNCTDMIVLEEMVEAEMGTD